MKENLINGDPWIWEDNSAQRHTCCDCGLSHQVFVDKYTTKKTKGVKVRFYRDEWETTRIRKREGIRITRKKNASK